MTRLRLTPWLAIPALLVMTGGALMAQAEPQGSDGGLMYIPLRKAHSTSTSAMQRTATSASAQEAIQGGLKIAQYGEADNAVSNRNKWLAVRFDPPCDPPYDITGVKFRSITLLEDPNKFASFRSVRLIAMNPATGLPDKSQTLYHQRRFLAGAAGEESHIVFDPPITITDANKSFFWVWEFPAPVAGVGDTFPFLYTDRGPTEMGLFANSFAMDTTGLVSVAPPALGTVVGSALLADQNIECSMTFSGTNPPDPPKDLGLNLLPSGAEWSFSSGGGSSVELVRRDVAWTVVASAPGAASSIVLPAVPGSGSQIWGVRTVGGGGKRSIVSNVTISGPTSVVGYAAIAEDADEPNGSSNSSDATSLPLPIAGRTESLWPAGDEDNFLVEADAGQVISVSVLPISVDFRNDMELVVKLFSKPNKELAREVGAPGSAVELSYTVPPPPGNSGKKGGPFVVHVEDLQARGDGQPNTPRVLVPAGYYLSIDVSTPAAFRAQGPEFGANSPAAQDHFAFANAGGNPVRGRATFSYVIPRGQNEVPVKLRIFDVRGRLVATLVDGNKSAGSHIAVWSGRVPAGAYFARLEAGSFVRTVHLQILN